MRAETVEDFNVLIRIKYTVIFGYFLYNKIYLFVEKYIIRFVVPSDFIYLFKSCY